MRKIVLLVMLSVSCMFAGQTVTMKKSEYYYACYKKSDIVKNTFEIFLIMSKLSNNPNDKKTLKWYNEFNDREIGVMLSYDKGNTKFKVIKKELIRSPLSKKAVYITLYTIKLLNFKGRDFSKDNATLYIADLTGGLKKRLQK